MKKIVDSIVFSLHGNFKDITSEDITKNNLLKEKIIKEDLNLIFEKQVRFDIQMVAGQPPEPIKKVIKKPQLVSADENKIIKFNDEKIEFWIKNIEKSSQDTLDEEEKIKKYLKIISAVYNIKCNNIVLNVDYVVTEFTESEAKKIYGLFLKPELDEFNTEDIKQWQAGITKSMKLSTLQLNANINMFIIRGNLSKEGQGTQDVILAHLNIVTESKVDKQITKSHIETIFDEFIKKYKDLYFDLDVKINETRNQ